MFAVKKRIENKQFVQVMFKIVTLRDLDLELLALKKLALDV